MKKSVLALAALMALSTAAFAKTDINTATEAQLGAIHGMDTVKAKSVVEYRQKHGAFKSVDELAKVPGFSHKTVAKLSKELSVGDANMSGTKTTPAAPERN